MGDGLIIAIVAVGFPLFGLGVFFFWRWQYGVWSLKRRQGDQSAHIVQIVRPDADKR
ncbi:MAG: hypothetical protein JNK35_03315 [Phycisphaerae bacterium]|nr:hypothetical protein [Phycisphaerae bacterium]